jgi:predicted kinase
MDCFGSISKVKKIEYKKTKEKFIKPEIKEDVPYVYIWSGVPGSGKDYLAEKNNFPIVSFDDLRIKLYKNLSGVNFINKSDAEIYIEAFKFCNEKNFDLSTMLSIEARKCLDKGISVNICNTSLTRKSRRKIINSIGEKYNYVVKQVFAPSEIIFERNKSRSSKNIPENVIERMMKTIQVPTMFEKRICDIEYIYNGQ